MLQNRAATRNVPLTVNNISRVVACVRRVRRVRVLLYASSRPTRSYEERVTGAWRLVRWCVSLKHSKGVIILRG